MKRKTNLANYRAVILAGGKGSRLYPITKEIPKPLLPVKRKPIINYLIELFQDYGIRDIAVLINKEFSEDFDWWKRRYYPKDKIKLVKESRPLGTFGGLYFLKKWISDSPFFLTNGDELKKVNLEKMAEFHQRMRVPTTIALAAVSDPKYYGVAVCRKGKVEKFIEKPKRPVSNYINSGLYLLTPEVFNYHPGAVFSMIETDLFPQLAKENKLAGFKFEGKWTDCGTWERYEKALKDWKR